MALDQVVISPTGIRRSDDKPLMLARFDDVYIKLYEHKADNTTKVATLV